MKKNTKLAFKILKKMNVHKIICSYIIFVVICAFILWRIEPQIDSIPEGIWYCFVAFTTIGFGDIVAITFVGRLITIILALYGIVMVAIITGVLVTYYQEANKLRLKNNTEELLEKIDKLPELSKKELKDLSDKLKKRIIDE